jgi:p-hydroxybenzoate 3-monooxygenase
LIEQWASDLLVETDVGARMQREGMFHHGVYFAFGGALHYINFRELVGKGVTIYGQQEVVKDLIERRLSDGGQILFEASDVSKSIGKVLAVRFLDLSHEHVARRVCCAMLGGGVTVTGITWIS